MTGIPLSVIGVTGYLKAQGANNYRFSEEGSKREEEDKRIRAELKDMEERIRKEYELRYAALLKDVNGIGQAIRSLRVLGDQRYHNSSLVHLVNGGQMCIADASAQAKGKHSLNLLGIAGLLREEIHE